MARGITVSTTMLTQVRQFVAERLWYATYIVNGTEHRADLTSVNVDDTGYIDAMFVIDSEVVGDATVTEVRLYDRNSVMWVSCVGGIDSALSHDGLLYQFRITIEVAT